MVGGGLALLATAVWMELTLLTFLAYAFCFAACFNAFKVLRPTFTATMARIAVPEDRETIRAAADVASESAQRLAVIVNNALSFDDVRMSTTVLAGVFVLAPFASLVTAQTMLVVLSLATALCAADRVTRAQVDEAVASAAEPLLLKGASTVRVLSSKFQAQLAAVSTSASLAAVGVVSFLALIVGSVAILFLLVRVASAALLVHTAAEALLGPERAGAGGDADDGWGHASGDPALVKTHGD